MQCVADGMWVDTRQVQAHATLSAAVASAACKMEPVLGSTPASR